MAVPETSYVLRAQLVPSIVPPVPPLVEQAVTAKATAATASPMTILRMWIPSQYGR